MSLRWQKYSGHSNGKWNARSCADRTACSNLDWHRLLELCALTPTLVIDEEGCYEPADFNDGLLFGTQGTWRKPSCMRVRLPGGKLNKAKKGELRFSLMMDLCYDAEGRIILDPDQGAGAGVSPLWRNWQCLLGCPTIPRARITLSGPMGAWDGRLMCGRLSHGRMLGILKSPSYAGMYFFRTLSRLLCGGVAISALRARLSTQRGRHVRVGNSLKTLLFRWVRPHSLIGDIADAQRR